MIYTPVNTWPGMSFSDSHYLNNIRIKAVYEWPGNRGALCLPIKKGKLSQCFVKVLSVHPSMAE